jgi:hypothetical protein
MDASPPRPLRGRRSRSRRVTSRQIGLWSFVPLCAAYIGFSIWVMLAPTTLPSGTIEREPVLLVLVPAVATLLAALTALVVTTVWWIAWASWHPRVRDMPAEPEATDMDDQSGDPI